MSGVNLHRSEPAAPQAATDGWWLALETAALDGSVALARVTTDEYELLACERLPRDRRSAQSLAPGIDRLLRTHDVAPRDLAAVAVAVGPGSFTGLRVGVVTVKTIAYATGAAPIGVDTLDALAAEAAPPRGDERLWAVLDAQRRELFVAPFTWLEGAWRREDANRRVARDEFSRSVSGRGRVEGPVAETLGLARRAARVPSAAGVLLVARRRWLAGEPDNALSLAPRYHRPSAAEEKASRDAS